MLARELKIGGLYSLCGRRVRVENICRSKGGIRQVQVATGRNFSDLRSLSAHPATGEVPALQCEWEEYKRYRKQRRVETSRRAAMHRRLRAALSDLGLSGVAIDGPDEQMQKLVEGLEQLAEPEAGALAEALGGDA